MGFDYSCKFFLSMMAIVFCAFVLFAAETKDPPEPDGDGTAYVGAVAGGTMGAGAFMMWIVGAGCTSSMCPLIVATSSTGLLSASALGAACASWLSSGVEACGAGAAKECASYIAAFGLIGSVCGYGVVKGFDAIRMHYITQER